MRYRLELSESVRQYLAALPMTRQGRLAVYSYLHLDFAAYADRIREAADRPRPGSPLFAHQYIFRDGSRVRALTLAVDDSTAAYGVLRVVYADCS